MTSVERAAPQLGVTLHPVEIKTANDLDLAFDTMVGSEAQALLMFSSAVTYGASSRIAVLSLSHRLPACGPFREAVAAVQLASLGPDISVMAKQGANYVDKIIKGATSDQLAVEQPSRYEFWINVKTAK